MIPAEKWKMVEADILTLQLSFDDQIFDKGASLVLLKWRQDPDLYYFSNYFEQTWILDLKFWYEGAAIRHPATNNGLESLNNQIKAQFTLRNKLSLPTFLSCMDTMLRDWSLKYVSDEFQAYHDVNPNIEKEAWKWIHGLDKNSILHWYGNSYIVLSAQNDGYCSRRWLQEYGTQPWRTFDDFSKWLFAGRLVTLPMMCTCRTNLKTYICKHAIGLSVYFGYYVISDPNKFSKLNKRRGRPKKAGPALTR